MMLFLLGLYLGVGYGRYEAAKEMLDFENRGREWHAVAGAVFIAVIWPASLAVAIVLAIKDSMERRGRK